MQVPINNAGISALVTGDQATTRRETDKNFYGPLHMTRAFAPILAANGGGAILNVLSAVSWFTAPGIGAYAASKAAPKAAALMLTGSARLELAAQGRRVVGVLMGLVDTDMAQAMDAPKVSTPDAGDGAARGSVT